jgi:hypothetical protein
LTPAFVAALAAAASCHAWADEPSPYYLGVSGAVTRNSNVFQQANANAQGDTYYSAGLLAGIDQMIGRQHLYANGSIATNRYQDFKQLDNTSYDLAAGLDWATIEKLTGTLRYDVRQGLVNYADANLSATTLTIKDLQRTQQLSASARYGSVPGIAFDGGLTHRRVDFSAVEDRRDYSQDVARLGVLWGKSDLLTLGVGGRWTEGDYPQAVIKAAIPEIPATATTPFAPRQDAEFGHDKSRRRDVDFTAKWSPSGVSVIDGRISLTRETHTQPTIPTFSGLTGAIGWKYKPAGRLSYTALLSRDTASENTFATLPVGSAPVRVNNDRLTTVAAVSAIYELTAKTSLNAQYRHDSGSVFSVDGTSGHSSTDNIGLGVLYNPTRHVTLACNLSHESRSSVYKTNLATCSAQFVLR